MADTNDGFMGGFASGLQQGTNMGYLRMQAQAMRENQMRQAQAMEMQKQQMAAEEQRAQQKMMIEKATTLNSLFARAKDPKRQKEIWRAAVPIYNQLLGTDFKPDSFTQVTASVFDSINEEWKNFEEGKQTYEKTMAKVGTLAMIADEEERKAIKDSESFWKQSDPKRGKKASSGGVDRDATILAQSYDDAWREEQASNINVKYGIEDLKNMPEVQMRVEKRARSLFTQRTGRSAPSTQGQGESSQDQTAIEWLQKNYPGYQATPANIKWAKEQMNG